MDEIDGAAAAPDMKTLLADLRELNQRLVAASERIVEARRSLRVRTVPVPRPASPPDAAEG